MREVMLVSPDQLSAEGRWFWGEYQEFGFDVKMQRASADPTLITVDRSSLKAGSSANRVRLIGESLPAQISVDDLDFGTGVKVKRIVSHSATEIVAEVDVTADAVSGKRDIVFRRSVLPSAIAVYDHLDYIKVTPDTSLARLGSQTHPKGFQQFEAIGYQRGADGKMHTADDVELGPIDVSWSVEEFYSTYGDDDKEFVGSLSSTGFFTPASDGPNPQRKFSRNNYGDVWVVATAKEKKIRTDAPWPASRTWWLRFRRIYVGINPRWGNDDHYGSARLPVGRVPSLLSQGSEFLYLVPAGAIFGVDEAVGALIASLGEGELEHQSLVDALTASGLTIGEAEELLSEMYHAGVIATSDSVREKTQPIPDVFPIQTLVMNLTNQCNLSCQYCYEFGADKVATPEGKPKFMDLPTAKASVDFLLAQSGDRRTIHITFFGGETLMNYPLLKEVVTYANEKAKEQGRNIDFSLTTNATLLTPTIIQFLSENHIGVTVSMDGPKEMHDQLRVFANGKGSYDIIEPKVRALIENHRTRPITARVTLTSSIWT